MIVHRLVIVLLVLVRVLAAAAADPPAKPTAESIRALIDRLGAADFSQRELADAELRHLGLEAFGELQKASQHDDLEIRLRVRSILQSIKQHYLFADLDPALRRVLMNYASLSAEDRHLRVAALVDLLPQQGIDAVARLARFEEDESIAQRAALGLLNSRLPADPARQRALAEEAVANLANSETTAAAWLRAWAGTILDPATAADQWEQICDSRPPSALLANAATVQERDFTLRRAWLDALLRAGREDDGADLIKELSTAAQVDAVRELAWMSWLLDRQRWSDVQRYAQEHADRLAANPRLRYLVAEAQHGQGLLAESEETARQAFEENPVASRLEVAAWLDDDRGHFPWAEREYRAILADPPADPYLQIRAHFALSDMLHDIERDDSAADTMEALIDLISRSEEVRKTMELYPRGIKESKARMHLYRALHARRQHDRTTELKHLNEGFAQFPAEIDLLIARYHFPQPQPDWHAQTLGAIESVCRRYQQEIQVEREHLDRLPAWSLTSLHFSVAQTMNEYAWVVSNTTGDFQKALEYSKLSNEYLPGSAPYLDTLGRCYFAAGDVPQAIRYQTMAWEKTPYEMQIRRQLDTFLAAEKKP